MVRSPNLLRSRLIIAEVTALSAFSSPDRRGGPGVSQAVGQEGRGGRGTIPRPSSPGPSHPSLHSVPTSPSLSEVENLKKSLRSLSKLRL
jgi:hypothetical protein